MLNEKPVTDAKLKSALQAADALKAKKAALEAKMKKDMEELKASIARAEREVDKTDLEYLNHGLYCLCGLLIKNDPQRAIELFKNASADPKTPAGHADAIKYALKNRKVI